MLLKYAPFGHNKFIWYGKFVHRHLRQNFFFSSCRVRVCFPLFSFCYHGYPCSFSHFLLLLLNNNKGKLDKSTEWWCWWRASPRLNSGVFIYLFFFSSGWCNLRLPINSYLCSWTSQEYVDRVLSMVVPYILLWWVIGKLVFHPPKAIVLVVYIYVEWERKMSRAVWLNCRPARQLIKCGPRALID